MKVDEFGFMEVLVNGSPQKRRAVVVVPSGADWPCRSHGQSKVAPEVRSDERAIEMISGKMRIITVPA